MEKKQLGSVRKIEEMMIPNILCWWKMESGSMLEMGENSNPTLKYQTQVIPEGTELKDTVEFPHGT